MNIADVNNIRIIQKLQCHKSDVTTCDFSPNFTLITGSSDKTVRVWDWTPGTGYKERPNSPLLAHKYQITCVRVSPQGSMVASASVDGTTVLWNLYSLLKLYTMTQVNGDAIRVCRFAPDSSILATAGDNGAICIWDLVHKSLIRTVFAHEGTTQSLAFTPDSQYLLSACSLEMIRVWYVQDLVDTTTLEADLSCLAKIDNAHDLGVFCIDISNAIVTNDNNPFIKYYKVATSGNSDEIKIWKITSESSPKEKCSSNKVSINYYDSYIGHTSSVTFIRYNNNGTYLISSSLDKTVKIWDTAGKCIVTLVGHDRYVNCVAITKDSTLITSGSTGSNDKQVFVWDLTGNISIESVLRRSDRSSLSPITSTIAELQLMRNVESDQYDVKMIEKIDDISDGAINCCCFNDNGILATASGDKLVKLFRIIDDNSNIEELQWSPLEGHTYAVNHVSFNNDGTLLASCSLDGCTNIWDASTGEKLTTLPPNNLSIKVCIFSPSNNNLLLTAGDDENARIWNCTTQQQIAILSGHLDAITSASFSPDGHLIATTSFNGDYRLWNAETYENIYIEEYVHETGIQNCDFSPNLEPIPNSNCDDGTYLFATCGHDSLVKLWRISIAKIGDVLDFGEMPTVKVWRYLQGHGGSVFCVRFSPIMGEFVCSTATDRQARLWSVYSGECLFVLDHDSIVTACSFSFDCSLLVVGCLDKTLWLWKLPQQLVFQTAVSNKIKCRTKSLIDWTTRDIVKWLKMINFEDIVKNVCNTSLDGRKLLTLSEERICSGLDLNEEHTERLVREIRWLKQDEQRNVPVKIDNIPHEFLCPITHEIMCEPVTCSDGHNYEKRAIAEWFMSGKSTSPLTNEILSTINFTFNNELRAEIHSFLDLNKQ